MKVPNHLGIILDGNRRWAKEKNLPALEGHRRGLDRVREVIKWCRKKGIKTLSLFVFSTENWKRPEREVGYIMDLAQKALVKNLKEISKAGIRVKVIGQKERLPASLREELEQAEHSTSSNQAMLLNFALSYGGRTEITEAVKQIVRKQVPAEQVTEQLIADNLWASDLDLIIRTGKEQRLSNFLIWQAAYSELYFSPKYWPDFSEADLDQALTDYTNRSRRFGR